MAISKRLRFEILRRDNHACRYCGAAAPGTVLVVDHVVPVALGGSDEPSNLATACDPCNSGKSATPLDAPVVADVEADALRWARAMAQATEMAQLDLGLRRARREAFLAEIWNEWTYEYRKRVYPFDLPPDWQDSIDRFWAAGIDSQDFEEAVRKAMRVNSRDPFKYMCGVLWGWISERQQIAMEIVRGDEAGNGA
jgi:hypothetical protein